MSQRTIRVNELIMREISELLHTRFKGDAVLITILDVSTSPDLRNARVYYSVLGGAESVVKARRFFRDHATEIRRFVSQKVILKYFPQFEFVYDPSIQRGMQVTQILDELDIPEENP
jgi:ribosome-binding factor A